MKHVVMIVPIDSDIDKTQDISEKYWYEITKTLQISRMRYSELEHHNGDDDSDDSITKGF